MCQRGAPDKLISNHAQVEIIRQVTDIIRTYVIINWYSEVYTQQQNNSERKYQHIKELLTVWWNVMYYQHTHYFFSFSMYASSLTTHHQYHFHGGYYLNAYLEWHLVLVHSYAFIDISQYITRLIIVTFPLTLEKRKDYLWVLQNILGMLWHSRSSP